MSARWRVRSDDGHEVEVAAADWMMAMVRATELLSIIPGSLHYAPAPDGTVEVRDPEGGHAWTIEPVASGERTSRPPPSSTRTPTPMSPPDRSGAMVPARPRPYRTPVRKPLWSPEARVQRSEAAPAAESLSSGRPAAVLEVLSSGRPAAVLDPPPNLAERLFELSFDIRSQRDARAAAARALQIALALVTCEAGSVLRGGADDEQLEFFVVQGGAGDALVGRKVPFHEGIAGACYDSGVTIRVDDVAHDPRHFGAIDRDTGFVTRSVLCVPVRSERGFHGVIELLNPRSPFLPWHVDVVESLAAALAETVAGR